MLALTILGNNSAIPAFDRNPTAQVLQSQDEAYLIDCGEGTQIQMTRYKIRRSKINHIFISHLHGDHYFGLIGLLTSMSLTGRTQDMHLYAPPALEQIINLHLTVADTNLSYRLYFHPIKEEGLLADENKITVHCFKVRHRIECWGFLFKEKKNPRKINTDTIKNYEIPASYYDKLQREADFRFGLIRTRENAEGIAFYDSDASMEQINLWSLFEKVRIKIIGLGRNCTT